MCVTPLTRLQHLEMASCQIMLSSAFWGFRVVQWRMSYNPTRPVRLDLTCRLDEAIDTPLRSFFGPPPPSRRFTMIDFLLWRRWWSRWVASAVVRVTTDLRHTDSRGLLHDQSSGRRNLGNPQSRDRPARIMFPMGNAIINMNITGVDKNLRERRGTSQSLYLVCLIRSPSADS